MFEMGQVVTDSATGFSGTITGIAHYAGGGVQYYVEAPAGSMDSSQQPGQARWFESGRLQSRDAPASGPGAELRAALELAGQQAREIETLQRLLDEMPCLCRLNHTCPKHDASRPARADG